MRVAPAAFVLSILVVGAVACASPSSTDARAAGPATAGDDAIRAYVKRQPLQACFPWLFRENADGAVALNHLSRRRPLPYEPNMVADFNTFARSHQVSRIAGSRPETDSAATYDPHSRRLLATLGWEEDASTTMLIADASAPAAAVAANDLAGFSIGGRAVLGWPIRALRSLYGPFEKSAGCGLTAATFQQDGPGGSRFAFVLRGGVVSAVFWFGN